jgi:hypothetical protein
MSTLWLAGVIVFLLNLPFGYLRASTRRLSLKWFLAIHIPVPIVIALRLLLGIGWHVTTFFVLVAAFSAGQLLGGYVRGQVVSGRTEG